MAAGSKVDYRTIFFATRDKQGKLQYRPREEIVTAFDSVYKSVAMDPLYREYLHEIEMSEREKIGPMSMFEPWEKDGPNKAKAVFRDKPQLPGFDVAAWGRALDRTQSLVKSQSCELISPMDAINGTGADTYDGMDTSTNSGTPWWRRKWKPSGGANGEAGPIGEEEETNLVFQWYKSRVEQLVPLLSRKVEISQLPYWYATASQRLVQRGPKPFDPKSKRLVEAYPKEEAILCKMFTLNVMQAMREVKLPGGNRLMCAWFDLPTVDTNMQYILDHAAKNSWTVNSGDISNFDATVPPWVLWDVGRMVATWVKGGQNFVENLVKAMVYRTILITPSGLLGPGPSSMKSGSGLTNLLGSLANATMQFYGEEIGLYSLSCLSVLGDDFISCGKSVNPDTTSLTFASFGMEAHPDKQYYQPNTLQYLKRLHVRGLPGGIASVYRTLGSCLSLERLAVKPKEWNKFAYVVQALSKLNNAQFNPGFTDLVTFLGTGDRLHLGAEMTPQEVVSSSGTAGQKILMEDARHSWKRMGDDMSFANWPVNGVIRGEKLPPLGKERFRRAYGVEFNMTV
jgi:hypothetical protein